MFCLWVADGIWPGRLGEGVSYPFNEIMHIRIVNLRISSGSISARV
jgi:hypothetical protein